MMNEVLKKSPLFGNLNEAELNLVQQGVTEIHLTKDELIFKEGDLGDALYIIGKGSVRVEKSGVRGSDEVLAILHAGESFGEISLVDKEVRSATCLANGEAVLYRLARPEFESLVVSNRDLALKIYQALVAILCERMRSTNEALTFSRTLLQGVMEKDKG